MFWDYAGDPTGTLLNTINASLRPVSAHKP
jgi:hypothetical protein